ncbi:putative clathrin assembly protein [Panicum miliaceum]|uniref:Clathrin assembly protein n=1 Tax=Panicum miliaceum TaxID=4540 RepID=A0A3L6THB3_PANMI|nr:putative clathrin assembly protein [Panicum miliaceum]
MALKCLVALWVMRGAFILRDQLLTALLLHPASGRNLLALAAFPLGRSSFTAASWSARLTIELAAFAAVADAVRHAPPPPRAQSLGP